MIPIEFDVIVFKEDETYVAFCPELDVSSCGKTVETHPCALTHPCAPPRRGRKYWCSSELRKPHTCQVEALGERAEVAL